jgi:carbonic anhydrase
MRLRHAAGGLSRRGLILTAGAGLVAAPAFAAQPHAAAPRRGKPAPAPSAPSAHGDAVGLAPEEAMSRLMAGNARYVAAKATHPNGDAARRRLVAGAQHPFATVLACADSRVAPELIFDQGLGDLFVVRVAGNVVDDAVLASIEYSVIHLGSTLVMALGHERCGAVKATADALDGHGSPEDADTRIGALAALIAPAVRAVPADAPDRVDAAVSLNAAQAAAEIFAGSRPLRARVLAGQIKIVAARYDLDDGRVSPARARGEFV